MPNKKIGLIALLAGFTASHLMAGTLTSYSVGDVLLCFRNGGQNDLVVDVGQISTFTNLTLNQRIDVSTGKYTGSQLHFVSTNAVSWSAFTYFTSDSTLFMSKARSSPEVITTPWQRHTGGNQQLTAFAMAPITNGVLDEAGYVPPGAGGTPNTATAVVEADNSTGNPDYVTGKSYKDALGGTLNFNGTFQGNPENTTANNFTTAGKVSRCDFYQLSPTTGFGQGKLLGYFELSTNGSMAYVAYPISKPVIKSFSRSGTMNTINYTTGIYGTYTLRATNRVDSGTAQVNWPAVAVLNTGDNSVHFVNDTTTDDAKFYTITTQ